MKISVYFGLIQTSFFRAEHFRESQDSIFYFLEVVYVDS